MDNECHANICVFVQNSPDPPIYRNSFVVNANINSNKIPIRYNIKVLNFNHHIRKSSIEVQQSRKS